MIRYYFTLGFVFAAGFMAGILFYYEFTAWLDRLVL